MKVVSDLEAVWERLSGVNSLVFRATSHNSSGGWNGEGRGSVLVEHVDSTIMLFHESGTWDPETGKQLGFTNVYRWTRLPEAHFLRLEHLRFGHEHPVYLFDLKQTDEVIWQSIEPHVCRDDLYTAIMTPGIEVLDLHWTIKGPAKDESVRYSYR